MKHFCFICAVTLLFLSCNSSSTTSTHPSQLIPEQFDLVLKINASESFDNSFNNNKLLAEITSYDNAEQLNAFLASLKDFNYDHSFISLHKQPNDSLDICLILPLSNNINPQSQKTLDSLTFTSTVINPITLNERIYYGKILDSVFFLSNKEKLTMDAVASETKRPEIEAFTKLASTDKMISVLSNNDGLNFSALLNNSAFESRKFSDYTIFDAEISQNAILWNGITRSSDSSSSINTFKNIIPQQNKVADVIPENTTIFKSFTFDDYDILRTNLNRQFKLDSLAICSELFQSFDEIAHVSVANKNSVVLKSIDPVVTSELLELETTEDEFRGISIYSIDSENITSCLFPLIATDNLNTLAILDDFFVFTEDMEGLESYISSYQNNAVLGNSEKYKNLMKELSDESSLLIYVNSDGLNKLTNTVFTDDIKLNISDYKSSAIQFVYDSDFAHINAAFTTYKSKRSRNSVTEEFDIKLDNDLIISPQLVRNHRTNQMDILTQDINNNLYLISNSGKVFWKKQLDGKIMGKVHQIDTYKNGRLQLVFNTSKRLYVLDRNGKDVNAFPLKFNDDITQPVSVFDYDKKKNYRLMITQGRSVLMYDKNGKIVSGFKYRKANNMISTQPKHFRIGRKDYIVFADGNRIEILDRVGKTRINVSDNISFSNNEIYLYQNKFTTSSTNGELIQINSKGNKTTKNLQVNSDHKITTTSKTLVVLNDNKLTIKSNSIDLDFGVYSSPRIFYINDKIYVSVTDLQSKKGYLFDSQAKPIANFPVFANSELVLGNIDKDNALEVVTKGDNNAIIVYELN